MSTVDVWDYQRLATAAVLLWRDTERPQQLLVSEWPRCMVNRVGTTAVLGENNSSEPRDSFSLNSSFTEQRPDFPDVG